MQPPGAAAGGDGTGAARITLLPWRTKGALRTGPRFRTRSDRL